MITIEDVMHFWFVEHGEDDWYAGSEAFDEVLKRRFSALHADVAAGGKADWRQSPEGRLAEVLVLDQFSRQIYRGRPEAFATDAMALDLARAAVAAGDDLKLEPRRRTFLYMPYMHSESLKVHDEEAIPIFRALGDEKTLEFELAHRDCIARFGRYPKRNEALGRISTPEEIEYINSGTGMF